MRYFTETGKEVLLVDLDPQGNASSGLGIDVKSYTYLRAGIGSVQNLKWLVRY